MKDSALTATDQFCGAGGSGQGIRKAGVKVKQALNHWKRATDTYEENFPEANVTCTDISACDPRRFVSTNILVTSPECTTHSPAGGNTHKALKTQMDMFNSGKIDAATERSRATMWDVCRFAEYHNYEIVIVENVVEAKLKWPLFDVWLKAMHVLGYNHKCCYLNSMHFGHTPQSRDRMYVVFWKKGNPAPDLNHMPRAHCIECGNDIHSVQTFKNTDKKFGKYKTQYVYRCPVHGCVVEPYYHAAFNAVDWTIPGNPAVNYVQNTQARIKYGLKKYKGHPFMVYLDHSKSGDNNVTALIDYARTQTTADSAGLVVPFIVNNNGQSKTSPIDGIFGAQTGATTQGIVTPKSMNAFLSYYYNTPQASHITEAAGTATTVDTHALVTYNEASIEDCMYRTFRPHEVQKIMAFENDYIITGNSKDKVKQLGNAVTPPSMEWLVSRCVATLN